MSSQRPRESVNEPPYTGPLGVTRREHAFVPTPDGAPRRVEVVRQVNVLADPLLARQALDGTLHRVQELELAVPYIFHDPTARRFALVIPSARAHEELQLRAELLTRLAADASEVLPSYVREGRTVAGPAGLRRYLDEAKSQSGTTDPRIEAAQKAFTEREERLHKRAQEVTRREDELVAAQNDLAERELELDRRTADVVAREEHLASEELALRANIAALTSRETRLRAREEALHHREATFSDATNEAAVARLDVGVVGVAEALEEGRRDSQIVESASVSSRAPAEVDAAYEVPEPERPSGEMAVSDDALEVDVEDLAPVRTLATGEHPRPSAPEVETLAVGVPLDTPELSAPESVAPAPAPRSDRAYVAVVEGEVRVWFQGSAEIAQQLSGGAVVPVLQADPDAPLPLAVLTIRAEGVAPVYTRVALDLTRPEDRAVVESLARDFRVRAEVVSPLGRALGGSALGAPCEANAQRVLALLTAREPGTAEAHQAALEALARDGVAWHGGDAVTVSFTDDHALSTAAGVEGALAAYEPLLDRGLLDRFVVARGVSVTQVEAFGKRLCLAALRCGVVPSEALVRRALELGIAPDERALATRALTAYARTVEGGAATIGRNPRGASQAWAPLLAWAKRVGVSVPDAARAAIASLYDPDDASSVAPPDGRAAPSPESYATMSESELVSWIDHPGARLLAARALARRDAAKHEAAIGKALKMLPGPQAAELAGELVRGGDALGDVWVELLASKRRAVAAVATAGAGVLKLRRALSPLMQRALAKDNADWKLAAWAAGEFGVAAVRALARTDTDQTERLAWTIGHAIRCGASKEVERTRPEGTKAFQDAATRALALQDEIRAWDDALRRGDGDLERLVQPVVTRVQTSGDASQRETSGST